MRSNEGESSSLISVIVPVYKVEKYLNRCIESIVKQSFENLEIILVDDGSPDRCPSICDDWARKDSRIKVIHKSNGGLSDARNAGMAIATGDYISFIDSDDWIAPDFFLKLIEAVNKDKSDISCCAVQMIWEDGSPAKMLTVAEDTILSRFEAQKELLSENKLKQPVWYKLYRRELIQNIYFEKGKCHEDDFWSYQAIERADKISLVNYIGYFYWQRTSSIMGEGYSIKRFDEIEAYVQRYKFFCGKNSDLENESLIALWEGCIYHGVCALKYFPKSVSLPLIADMRKLLVDYPINWDKYKNKKISHRIWISLARLSLLSVCRLKLVLKVGC